ncbi:MAG: hypothetical protein SF187_30810 [Deltaproteobacteria bacterium]|nr:hypothetical protein [Deltaproteobacteria bacterium]
MDQPQAASLPFQPDYAQHPAFKPHIKWNATFDARVAQASEVMNQLLLRAESDLTLKKTSLTDAIGEVNQGLGLVTDLLVSANQVVNNDFSPFAKRFHHELLRVVFDDLAYFDRRNSYVPVINDAHEMGLRNSLAVNGFIHCTLTTDELAGLQVQVQPYVDELQRRYKQGQRGREALSTNQLDPRSMNYVKELFARRGLDRAVSNVRHEPAAAWGFAVEISPDDNPWWHSRYKDVGLTEPGPATYYHNDESRDVYKAIIYLGDVTEDLGPFSYVPVSYAMERPRFAWTVSRATLTTLAAPEIRSTMTDLDPARGVFTSQVARKFFGLLPAAWRLNSHFGFDVVAGTPLANEIKRNEVALVAPAGQCIVFDGSRLIHRGGLVRKGCRVALQVMFEVPRQNVPQMFKPWSDKFNLPAM